MWVRAPIYTRFCRTEDERIADGISDPRLSRDANGSREFIRGIGSDYRDGFSSANAEGGGGGRDQKEKGNVRYLLTPHLRQGKFVAPVRCSPVPLAFLGRRIRIK